MPPTVHEVFGYKLVIHSGNHPPVHFHAKRGRLNVKFYILSTGEVILDPNKQYKIPSKDVRRLLGINPTYLLQIWNTYNPHLQNIFYDTWNN